jgi:DNA adenine methylase
MAFKSEDEDQGLHTNLGKENTSILSPLRYPGSKRYLSAYIKAAIRLNNLRPNLFVEPFAGGASVAIQLLAEGIVENIGLAELDPLVAGFWQTVFFDTDWLIERIETMEITLEEWRRYKNRKPKTHREQAAKCIFLNRTSFSGILSSSARPLGGRNQNSKYKIDCRFNKKDIINRIRKVSQFRGSVAFVLNESWDYVVDYVEKEKLAYEDVFYYFDPPFYEKAGRLYNYYFEEEDHLTLHKRVATLTYPWIMSYDPAPYISELYSRNGFSPKRVALLYSAGGTTEARELIITNLPLLPEETQMWRISKKRRL